MLGRKTSVHLLQQFSESRGRPELRDGIEFRERASEGDRQAPQGCGAAIPRAAG